MIYLWVKKEKLYRKYEDGIDIKTISKITGKTSKEIESIKEENKL